MLYLAGSLPVLLVARILHGLSGSITWTVAVTIMTDRVETRKFGANLGLLAVARSAGLLLGPSLGGVLYAMTGYIAMLGISFGFLVADIMCRCFMIEAREARKWDPSISPEMDKTKNAGDNILREQEDPELEERLPHSPPFIPLLSSIRLLVSMLGFLVQAIVFSSMNVVLPLFVKKIFHWNSPGAGLVFLSLTGPTCLSPLLVLLANEHGPRWYVSGGLLTTAILLVLLRLVTDNSIDHKIILGVFLCLLGAFGTCSGIPLLVEVASAVELKSREDPKRYGGKDTHVQAFELVKMSWAVGMVIGPIWGGFVFKNAGWETLTWTLALLVAIGVAPMAIWVEGSIFDRSRERSISSSSSTTTLVNDGGEKGELKDVF